MNGLIAAPAICGADNIKAVSTVVSLSTSPTLSSRPTFFPNKNLSMEF